MLRYCEQTRATLKAMRARHSGFTLIEVLIAVFIIGMLIALFGVGVMMMPLSREASHRDVALHGASVELETLRSTGYAQLPTSGSFSNTEVSSLPGGLGTTTIRAYNNTTKEVVVTVSWQEPGRGYRAVSLTTLITETGGLP